MRATLPSSAVISDPWWRGGFQAWSVPHRFLAVLLVVYIVKQALTVVLFPPFTGHDEVAHYAYLRTVATEHRVPILLKDRLPDDLYQYCSYTLGWACGYNFVPRIDTLGHPLGLQYAANHPPLYYIMMTPLYWVSDGASPATQQYLLRLAAIPFGVLTVILAFLLARALFPGDAFLAIAVPAFVAFQTQISYEAAMVNNDIISIAAYSWILYLLVIGIRDRFPSRICVLAGFAFGLALLAKGTSLTAGLLIALAIIATIGLRHFRTWIGKGVLTVVPAAVLAAPWYAFLYHTYGNLTGFKQIEEIQWWNKPYGTFWGMLSSGKFVADRFQETWGDFGWRRIPLHSGLLWAIAIPLIVGVAGLVVYAITIWRRDGDPADPVFRPAPWQRRGVLLLVVTCIIAYLAIIQFGTQFQLTQARYYFPAVNAAALLLMLGLRTLIPRRLHPYGQATIIAALFALNLLIYTQYVLPYYPYW